MSFHLSRAARLRAWCINAWDQYPGVVASSFLPLALLPFAVYKYQTTPDSAHSNKYLLYPLVCRPGDPRIKRVHTTDPALDDWKAP